MFLSPTGSYGMRSWVSNAFGAPRNHPGPGRGHAGVDLTAPVGHQLRNIQDGTVKRIYHSPYGGGWVIEVSHGDVPELGRDVVSRHMHCKEGSFVVEGGDDVFEGDILCTQGATGNALDDHDHFEIRVSGQPVDPWPLLADFQYSSHGLEVGTLYPYWSIGPMARLCQSFLQYRGYDIAVDGVYGPGSQGAVKDFQRDQGLIVDAIVGPMTWDALIPNLG